MAMEMCVGGLGQGLIALEGAAKRVRCERRWMRVMVRRG